MGWIILTVLLGIVFWGGIIFWGVTKPGKLPDGAAQEVDDYGRPKRPSNNHYWGLATAGIAVVLWIIVSAAMSFHTVGQRETAIVYNFSNVITGTKSPGVVTTKPWEHIKKVNVGIQHDEWLFDIGNNTSAVSLDQQRIGALLSLNYQINSGDKQLRDLYSEVGPSWKTIIIDARVPQVFKEVTATYATADITANREQLRKDTKARLVNELAKYDIDVVDVFVKNLGFSQSYTDAVDAKQKQVQDALRQEAKIREAKAIGDQKVETAKRNATANIAEARGEATANKLRQRSLTKLLVQQQAIEKLNDKVTLIVCPPASVCIPNAGVIPNPSGN
jgi:regulator of protease activity HflC (stomatin/prohibitin superfamily)